MLDLGNYDLVVAPRKVGCPLYRVLAEADVRAMDTFVDAGGQLSESTELFCERGGFCREHAWLFHRRAALALTGARSLPCMAPRAHHGRPRYRLSCGL